MMPVRQALGLLGLEPGCTAAQVRKHYANAVMADHPDRGGPGTLIGQLKRARDALMCQHEVSPCVLCKGRGRVQSRFGAQTCTACEGSGDRRP